MFRYSRRQMILHWIVVALLLFQYLYNGPISAAFHDYMHDGVGAAGKKAWAHMIVGFAILIVAGWRLALRRREPAPPAEQGGLAALASLAHWGLYALLLALPLTGIVAWFAGSQNASTLHHYLQLALLWLAGLHVAAALFHQFVLRDGRLSRMAPR